jgi:hypothetical protein
MVTKFITRARGYLRRAPAIIADIASAGPALVGVGNSIMKASKASSPVGALITFGREMMYQTMGIKSSYEKGVTGWNPSQALFTFGVPIVFKRVREYTVLREVVKMECHLCKEDKTPLYLVRISKKTVAEVCAECLAVKENFVLPKKKGVEGVI